MISLGELSYEILEINPSASLKQIADACGVAEQVAHQALIAYKARKETTKKRSRYISYEVDVDYARLMIKRRGHIWEGARRSFENGTYEDRNLDRMLREKVIIPADDPDGGYVLP